MPLITKTQPTAMRINKIVLHNFRGFATAALDVHERMNVFCGANGAGKSTVLDAAAMPLSWIANRIKTNTASGRPISELDIHNEKPSASISVEGVFQNHEFSIRLVKVRRGCSNHTEKTAFLIKDVINSVRQIAEKPPVGGIPVFAYYPVNRAVLDIPLRIRTKHEFGIFDAYENALTGAANFRTFFEWFRNREDIENEIIRTESRRRSQHRTGIYADIQLMAVRQAVAAFLPDVKHLEVKRNPLGMYVTKKGKKLRVDQLSDGEKCLMAMVGDIARRLAIANPNGNPLGGDGIILIDEIDLHLHPQRQREVLAKLSQTFPNCQFIVSTHSPQVLGEVRSESVFRLTADSSGIAIQKPVNEIFGQTVSYVLGDIMAAADRNPEIQHDVDALYTSIERGDFENCKRIYSDLKSKSADLPEFVGFDMHLRHRMVSQK